jgi:hypothetical protein
MKTASQILGLGNVSTSFIEAIEKATPIMQAFYRMLREEGFSRADAKNIMHNATLCGILNEGFGKGVDDVNVED